MDFIKKITLGRSGLQVANIGVSSSFGADAATYERAFELGCNYFTLGTFIKGKSGELIKALKNLIAKGKREELVIALLHYSHITPFMKRSVQKTMEILGTEYLDVLLMGYYSNRPNRRMLNATLKLKQKNIIRATGITGHNRNLISELEKQKLLDLYHVRYNAVNSGAEKDVFPLLNKYDKPGIVSFTATAWGKLLDQKKYPQGATPLSAGDCYRFVLSNPNVDVCMMGVKNSKELEANFKNLEKGLMTESEINNIRSIGDYIYGKPRK